MGVWQLTRRVMGQSARAGIEIRQYGSTLERCGGDSTVGETPADNDVGFRERTCNISAGPAKPEGDIARHRIVKPWRTFLHCRFLVGDRRQLLISNRDGRNRVFCRISRFGGYRGDWLSGVANAIARQDRMLGYHTHAWRNPVAREVADIGQFIGCEYVDDAGQ